VPVLHGCSQCVGHAHRLPQEPPPQGNPSGFPTQRGLLCFLISTALALALVAYRLLARHRGFEERVKRSNVKMPVLSAHNER
jgi:hypothetical protein